MNNDPSKQATFYFDDIRNEDFLYFLRSQGNSKVVGPVGTQYEKELQNKTDEVKIFAFYACDEIVGAISFSVQNLPYDKESVGLRLDTVITAKNCRGHGVGSLLISEMFRKVITEFGEKIKVISTVAVHPGVAKCMSDYSFDLPMENSSTPRFHLSLDSIEKYNSLKNKVEKELLSRHQDLKLKCFECKTNRGGTPWCKKSTSKEFL